MGELNLKKEVSGTLDTVVYEMTDLLAASGFGVLTRIDLHARLQETLGRRIQPTVIIGACDSELAFQALSANTDAAALIPCNAVVRELAAAKYSVELAKPSALLRFIGDRGVVDLAKAADSRLAAVLDQLQPSL